MQISDEQVEKAMAYLAETDLEFANWRAAVLRTEYLAEVAESMVYKSIQKGSVEDKKRTAKVAPETQKAQEEHFKAVVGFRTVEARRARAVLLIECWRTLQANRRQGAN